VVTTPLKVENNTIKYISLDIKGPNTNGMKPFQEFRWQVTKFVTSKRFELEKVLYKNQQV
jgi:hypothetical protein